jgi:hypothetical protein
MKTSSLLSVLGTTGATAGISYLLATLPSLALGPFAVAGIGATLAAAVAILHLYQNPKRTAP